MERKAKLSLGNRYDMRVDPSDNLPYPQKQNKIPGVTVDYIKAYNDPDMPEYDAIGWNESEKPKRIKKAVKVSAQVSSDDNAVRFRMSDCSDWLRTLDAEELRQLEEDEWGCCGGADNYAYWLEDKGNPDAERLFRRLDDGDNGFEVRIDPAQAKAWMKDRKKGKGEVKKVRTYLEGMKKEKALIKAQKAELRRVSQSLSDEEKRVRRKLAFSTVLRIRRAPMSDFDF